MEAKAIIFVGGEGGSIFRFIDSLIPRDFNPNRCNSFHPLYSCFQKYFSDNALFDFFKLHTQKSNEMSRKSSSEPRGHAICAPFPTHAWRTPAFHHE
ncbi:hypothetical protein CEXT_626961 [Caerostris extrusa]|uniref:Uncharacterized protein n=1 Tax=Caerostris extrusa TaxID=172846 RepID=A0AAV4M5R3_CAEEX|nr:hypothetical protein CEXT_626961 [Caerostris extrusa]